MKSNTKTEALKESNHHDSVLFRESIEGLNIKSDGIYIDATLGRMQTQIPAILWRLN